MSEIHAGDKVTVDHPSCHDVALTMVGWHLDRGKLILQPPSGPPILVDPTNVKPLPTVAPIGKAKPLARSTDPDASHAAAKRAKTSAQADEDALLIAHADAGDHGMTGDDIGRVFGSYESVGPRRPRLERAGLVEKVLDDEGQQIKRNRKGVYRITTRGRIEADRLRRESA